MQWRKASCREPSQHSNRCMKHACEGPLLFRGALDWSTSACDDVTFMLGRWKDARLCAADYAVSPALTSLPAEACSGTHWTSPCLFIGPHA